MITRASDRQVEATAQAPLLFGLKGEAVTGVEFFGENGRGVLLRFGAARLEVISKACVRAHGESLVEDDPSWRGALLGFIAARLQRIALDRGRELVLEFDNGRRLTVSLRPEDGAGPEAAVFFDEAWRYEPY